MYILNRFVYLLSIQKLDNFIRKYRLYSKCRILLSFILLKLLQKSQRWVCQWRNIVKYRRSYFFLLISNFYQSPHKLSKFRIVTTFHWIFKIRKVENEAQHCCYNSNPIGNSRYKLLYPSNLCKYPCGICLLILPPRGWSVKYFESTVTVGANEPFIL